MDSSHHFDAPFSPHLGVNYFFHGTDTSTANHKRNEPGSRDISHVQGSNNSRNALQLVGQWQVQLLVTSLLVDHREKQTCICAVGIYIIEKIKETYCSFFKFTKEKGCETFAKL